MQNSSELVGISLIDKFAMAALTGILASIRNPNQDGALDTQHVAENAYALANSMMEQRLTRTDSRYGKKKK